MRLMQILLTCGRCVTCAISHISCLNIQCPNSKKITIGHSELSCLESEEFLKSVTTKNPLDPIDSLSMDLSDPLSDDHINIIVVQWPTCELLLTFLFRVLLLTLALFPCPSANFFSLSHSPLPYCAKVFPI